MPSLFQLPKTVAVSGASSYPGSKLYFYSTGTTNLADVYTNAALTIAHSSPVVADADGVFAPIYLDPAVTYKVTWNTSAGALIYTVDPANDSLSAETIGRALYPRTAAEIAEGVTPTNYTIPSHDACGIVYVNRYGTNTTPGTTDMSDALQSAVDVALTSGCRVMFGKGAYKIVTPPTFGAATIKMKPLDIGGVGNGTQIINAASASSPTFNMSNVSGFYLHDMLLTGTSANKNDGIFVKAVANGAIRWRVERIVSFMAGRGIVLHDTNTGVIRDFKHWPDNGDELPTVAQSVTMTDVDHGIYMTGGYCHDISIYDADCFPRDSFKSGACGIRCDASGPNHGIRLFGGMVQGNSGNGRDGIFLDKCNSFLINGTYHESSVIRLRTATSGAIVGSNNGEVEGKIVFEGSSINNTLIAVNASALEFGVGATSNTVIGCAIATITDDAKPANRYIGSRSVSSLSFHGFDRGGDPWITVAYSASMTPDCADGRQFNIVPNNSTAFTINEPLHPLDGETITIKIRNATGGALGALTWGAQYRAASSTQPSNGYSIVRRFTHDKSYGSGVLWIQTGADVTVAN
jgi:hypothetical protein